MNMKMTTVATPVMRRLVTWSNEGMEGRWVDVSVGWHFVQKRGGAEGDLSALLTLVSKEMTYNQMKGIKQQI